MSTVSNSIKKSAVIITILTLGYKLIGFLKEVLLAYFFGTSATVDAYVMALAIPTVLFGWISSLAVSYVPFYYELEKEKKVNAYTNSLIIVTVLIALVCILCGELLAPQIVHLCAPGYEGQRYRLTLTFYKIYVWSCMFIPLYKILVSYVKCKKAFVLAIVPDLFYSLIVVIVIFLCKYFGNEFLAYGNLYATIIQFGLILIIALKLGYKFRPEISQQDYLKKTLWMAIPIFFSNMVIQINLFVDRIFASNLREGSLSALNYGETIKDFVYYLGSIAVLTIIFPLIAEKVANKEMTQVARIINKGIALSTILFIPLQFGILFFANPVIEIVFERGMFSSSSSDMTSNALLFYSLGLIAIVINAICQNLYYSIKKTKLVLITSLGSVAINVMLNIILVSRFEYKGLALSTSISAIVFLPVNLLLVKHIISEFEIRHVVKTFVKVAISSVIMIVCIYPIYMFMYSMYLGLVWKIFVLFMVACIGASVYTLLLIILKEKEVYFYINMLKSLMHKFIKQKNGGN